MIELDFFDTNILLYSKIDDSSQKHKIAKDLVMQKIFEGNSYISTQVANEFTVNALRKGKNLAEVEDIVKALFLSFNVISLTTEITTDAFRISNRYRFSFWDSLIVASALDAGCSVLYTEDLQNGQIIDGVLEVKNPFAGL